MFFGLRGLPLDVVFFANQVRQDTPPETVLKSIYEKMEEDRNRLHNLAEVRARLISDLELKNMELQKTVDSKNMEIADLKAEIERLRQELKKRPLADQLENYLARVSQTRREVLERLRDAISDDFPDLEVELSEENDAKSKCAS